MNDSTYQDKIDYFARKGTGYKEFAVFAAQPIVFSTELLYLIWFNFRNYISNYPKGQPSYMVVSDLILSSLVSPIGHHLFCFQTPVREILLPQIDPKWEIEIAEFVKEYTEKSKNIIPKNIQEIFSDGAMSVIDPNGFEKNIYEKLKNSKNELEKNNLLGLFFETNSGRTSAQNSQGLKFEIVESNEEMDLLTVPAYSPLLKNPDFLIKTSVRKKKPSVKKSFTIFLISSLELQQEREKFENLIRRQNKLLIEKNVTFNLETWEDVGSELNNSRKQDEYNKRLQEVEIVVLLFWTKMGKYTLEEFDLAYQMFKESGKPLIYVFEKTTLPPFELNKTDRKSKESFLRLIQDIEQFHEQFESYHELENSFKKTLDVLIDSGFFTYQERAKMLSPNGPISPNLFLGREKELETLKERFEKSPYTLLIHAEGGMGKTALASKYWYESKYRYSNQAWLFCDQGIMDALKTLIPNLGLDPTAFNALGEADQIATLKTAISNLEGDFLLVLDDANNAEDIQVFLKIFRGFNWNVLITSRCRDVLRDKENELNLDHLSPEEAGALFQEYYSEEVEEFKMLLDRILKGLNYHTLLIEVFAKNLKVASELGMDLKSFLGELQDKGLILDEDNIFEIRRNRNGQVERNIATTGEIIELLKDNGKLTEEERRFLVNMALLPSENYTLEFLLELFEPEDKSAFKHILESLYRKGEIRGNHGEKTLYFLSRITQLKVQIINIEFLWKDSQPLFQRLKKLLDFEKEKSDIKSLARWVSFGEFFAENLNNSNEIEYANFVRNLALVLKRMGGNENLNSARNLLEKSLKIYFLNLGEDHSEVANLNFELGLILHELGGIDNLQKAKELFIKSLNSQIKNLGSQAPAVSESQSNLALVLQNLGGEKNLLEAKRYLENALTSNLKNFGEKSPSVATTYSNMASVLKDIGGKSNLSEAKLHLEKALSTNIRNFGEESPSVATNRSNLALILFDLGGKMNLLVAREQIEKALASNIRNFGEDSPAVALMRSNLSMVLQKLKGKENLNDAKELLEMALVSDIRNLGEESIQVAKSHSNLAAVYIDLGEMSNYSEAKSHLEKAINIYIKLFGEQSKEVLYNKKKLNQVNKRLKETENKPITNRAFENNFPKVISLLLKTGLHNKITDKLIGTAINQMVRLSLNQNNLSNIFSQIEGFINKNNLNLFDVRDILKELSRKLIESNNTKFLKIFLDFLAQDIETKYSEVDSQFEAFVLNLVVLCELHDTTRTNNMNFDFLHYLDYSYYTYSKFHLFPKNKEKNELVISELRKYKDKYTEKLIEDRISWVVKDLVVKTKILNVRKGPSTSYEILANLEIGEIVKGYEIENGWVKISYSNEFWVSDQFLEKRKKGNEVSFSQSGVDLDKKRLKDFEIIEILNDLNQNQNIKLSLPVVNALIDIESAGKGHLENGKAKILFEGHEFWRLLKELGKTSDELEILQRNNPDILYKQWTKNYYKGGIGEYDRLERAKKINEKAAVYSTSWGLFQIMGENLEHYIKSRKYKDFREFEEKQHEHEKYHLMDFLAFIQTRTVKGKRLIDFISENENDYGSYDWESFARSYNGSGYKVNEYDKKLKTAFQKYNNAISSDEKSQIKIFISYSSKERELMELLRDGLKAHLSQHSKYQFQFWSDTEIDIGSNWRENIEAAMEISQAAILLISANFAASEFINKEELTTFFKRKKEEGFKFIPVLVRNYQFENFESLSSLQFFKTYHSEYGYNKPIERNKLIPFDKLAESEETTEGQLNDYYHNLARKILSLF